ncbi:MAG: ribosome rescue GTPase HflX [Gammaproteobacteria bacterium]|nr:ribosome rescue GTPase HflX [Gammaproteobacteria bacterium]
MFERPQTGTRAVLVQLDLRSDRESGSREEFEQLAVSAGVIPVAMVGGSRDRPDPKFFIGSGKVQELQQQVEDAGADLVLIDHPLSPIQERNLERELKCRVVDRTGLILDIFAQRARTSEGKLQVELAQLKHLATRLVRGWSHLERQKGGIGLRGPGETQLETDRRLIGKRIRQLNKRIEGVRRHRELGRSARRKATVRGVSLVGYTNAGKSTLFNRLTGARVYEADQLFATLDPTLRRISVPGVESVVLADTVGFISDLPPDLVAAFRATLEETLEADLLLHVIDAHDEDRARQIDEVNGILEDIGAGEVPQIQVYNKIDLREDAEPRIDRDEEGRPHRVWLSARDGTGIDLLRTAIAERLGSSETSSMGRCYRVRLASDAGRVHALLFEWKAVRGESVNEQGEWLMNTELTPAMAEYLRRQPGCEVEAVERFACDLTAGTLKSATG